MTREEAAKVIENRFSIMDYCESEKLGEALDMAIEALKAEPCEDCRKAEEIMQTLCDYGCEMKIQDAISQVLETECTKCEDAVSREAALKALGELPHEYKTKEQRARTGGIAACQTIVGELPPITPKPRTGHWIMTSDYLTTAYGSIDYVKCSCCGEDSLEEGNYCPNCGTKLEGVSE